MPRMELRSMSFSVEMGGIGDAGKPTRGCPVAQTTAQTWGAPAPQRPEPARFRSALGLCRFVGDAPERVVDRCRHRLGRLARVPLQRRRLALGCEARPG